MSSKWFLVEGVVVDSGYGSFSGSRLTQRKGCGPGSGLLSIRSSPVAGDACDYFGYMRRGPSQGEDSGTGRSRGSERLLACLCV